MGKTAENEKIKLRANLLNNCAVGLLVAGVILPALGVYTRIPGFLKRTEGQLLPPAEDLWVIGCAVLAFFVALWGAGKCHKAALEELNKLQD
jgi:hypothetical protein